MNQEENILFIGKRHYTNRDALAEKYGRIYQLPHNWVITGRKTKLWLLDYHGNNTEHRWDNGLEIISTPLKKLSWVAELIKYCSSVITGSRPSVIVASGDCYIGFLAWILARTLRARFVFDVYDKYDEFSGYRRLLGFDLFAFLLKHADHKFFASAGLMKQLCLPRAGNCTLVPNGIDTKHFTPINKLLCRDKLGLPDKTALIGYFGSMEPDRGVKDLIDAISLLRNQNSNIKLLLGGQLNDPELAKNKGVIFLGNMPFNQMPTALGACDLIAIPYRRSKFMDAGASNKIAEAIACGRPIVTTNTPNFTSNFTTQADKLKNRLAEPNNASSLAETIKMQLEDPIFVDMPKGFDWQDIARSTLHSITPNSSTP